MWHPHKQTVKKLQAEIASLKQSERARAVAAEVAGIAGQMAIQDMIKNPDFYKDRIRALEGKLQAIGLSSL